MGTPAQGFRRYRRRPLGRAGQRLTSAGAAWAADWIKARLTTAASDPAAAARVDRVIRSFSRWPWAPPQWVPWTRSPARSWPAAVPAVPTALQTQPGIHRNPAAVDDAYRSGPLHSFFALHADSMAMLAPHLLATLLSVAPNLMRSTKRLLAERDDAPHEPTGPAPTPPQLTADLKAYGASIGLGALGVAPYDERYTFAEYRGLNVGDRVVVALLEQNFRSTQLIPSLRSEQAALSAYCEIEDRISLLAAWLRRQGYRARPDSFAGESVFIHYGVAAGLGQLGHNGQLLTPAAGSRCRIIVLTTDAPLDFDEPVDYGMEGICDRCQICVRRCPVGAIPTVRKEHRGILKVKLNTKQCLPVVTQVEGCAVCMKVCPVQRYGLAAVLEEFGRSGEILGKGTDELEGYDWPLDGRHYGPGNRPRMPLELVRPEGFPFDAGRTEPPPRRVTILPGLADLFG